MRVRPCNKVYEYRRICDIYDFFAPYKCTYLLTGLRESRTVAGKPAEIWSFPFGTPHGASMMLGSAESQVPKLPT